MSVIIEPCPAMSDGTPRQCGNCDVDIEIGADATKNEYRTWVHPGCVDTPRSDEPIPEWVPPPVPDCPADIDPRAWSSAVRELRHWQWEREGNYERRLVMYCLIHGDRCAGETP